MDTTLFVFHRAADARAFNRPEDGSREPFRVLPFASLAPHAPAPPERVLRASHPRYPIDRLRVLMGIA